MSTRLQRPSKQHIQLDDNITTPTMILTASPTVVMQEDTFQQHADGLITGIIMWNLNGTAFPDDEWNDFVVVILGWWTSALLRLLCNNSTAEMLDMMDGPFSVVCNGSGESVSCQFVERRLHGAVAVASWAGKTRDLAREILAAGKYALRTCHEHGWTSSDITLLEKEVRTLRRMI